MLSAQLPVESSPAIDRRRFMQLATAGLSSGALSAGFLPNATADEPAFETTDESIRRLAAEAPLSLQFNGSTPAEVKVWQAKFSAKLRVSLGPHQPPATWTTVVEHVTDFDDHRREQLVLVAKGHMPLPVYVLTPKGLDKPAPGVLAIHGHGSHGYDPVAGRDDLPGVANSIESANYDYGRQLVRQGYMVICPCMTPFGRRRGNEYAKQDPCAVTFVRLQLLGKVLMGENVRDCLWAFEHLARHKLVDDERMACVGLSYGGRMTMLTSALEPRIRVAVISGALNVMQERIRGRYSCGAQVVPGLLQYGDVPEISSLIAPRHAVWETGANDGLIVPGWSQKALERIRRAYQAYGAKDRLIVDRFDGGHRWNGKVAVPLMDKLLKS